MMNFMIIKLGETHAGSYIFDSKLSKLLVHGINMKVKVLGNDKGTKIFFLYRITGFVEFAHRTEF
jgi:hypothetical protein